MSSVSDALAGFKAVLANIDPSPQPVPVNIYEWPADYESFDYTTFSFIIVAQSIEEVYNWQPAATGVGYHNWTADILVCLTSGPTTRAEAAAAAETKHESWLFAMAEILFNNQGVNGTALNIGTSESLFTYRVGHIGWDNQTFWGIRFMVPVRQLHSLPSI